uniref:Uncharacterized protein n=1 Tax=Meloidogyne hapla TaxID=6305 RepID=A0A1I8BJS6_MELHA
MNSCEGFWRLILMLNNDKDEYNVDNNCEKHDGKLHETPSFEYSVNCCKSDFCNMKKDVSNMELNVDGENKSVKFNKEEIKHLKHYKDSKLAKSSIIKNASKHKGIYAPGEESTYRAESSYYTVKKAEEGILPVEIDKSKFHGAFRFDQSKCILKLI